MDVTIYHNPACSTSRNALAIIRAAGIEPRVVEYLATPLKRAELAALLTKAGKPPRDLMRRKDTPYDALDLDNPKWSDDELLDFIVANPILMNRPIVVSDKGVRLCRPSEEVAALLPADALPAAFTKEDGEIVSLSRYGIPT